MTCPHCDAARQGKHVATMQSGCQGCIAREIARGPQFHEAHRANRITPAYKKLLQRYYGDAWVRGHALVKEWAS
jgi:hypothetical protein